MTVDPEHEPERPRSRSTIRAVDVAGVSPHRGYLVDRRHVVMVCKEVSDVFEVSVGVDADPRTARVAWSMECGVAEPRAHIVWLELELPVDDRASESAEVLGAAEMAKALLTWALALLAMGRREEASRVLVESVEFCSPMESRLSSIVLAILERFHPATGPRPPDFFDPFVRTLLDALLDAFRELAQDRPDVFFSDRYTSLWILVDRARTTRPYDETLVLHEGFVNILRQSATDHPDVARLMLAKELDRFGTLLSVHGEGDRAIEVLREAVQLRRILDEGTGGVELARALEELGGAAKSLGNYDEALRCRQEAVDIRRRRLSEGMSESPDREQFSLGLSLMHLGEASSLADRTEYAYRVAGESVELLRAHGTRSGTDSLIRALCSLGHHASDLGRLDEALEHTREAMRLLGTAEFDPCEAYVPVSSYWLTQGALELQGSIYMRAEKYQEALDSWCEALRALGDPVSLDFPPVAKVASALVRSIRRACEAGELPVPDEWAAIVEQVDPSR